MKTLKKYFSMMLLSVFLIGCQSGSKATIPQEDIPSTNDNPPTEPGNPTDPTDPSNPTDPTDPEDPPADPIDPDDPDDPIDPDLPEIDYVKVFAKKSEYDHVYAWINNNQFLGSWPGTSMTSYDDTWNTYEIKDYTSFNIIFNNNKGKQTPDLSISKAGYYWCINDQLVDNSSSGGDNDPTPTGDILPDDPDMSPLGNYTIVKQAETALDLPAVKNYTGTVKSKCTGNRMDFRDESIYFIITTRFFDGDSSNNVQCWDGSNPINDPAWRGDFKGLIQKMDYIKALGFTSIWITPVVKNGSGYDYHGYHAINFKEIDPRYLSNDTGFQDVINAAHQKDMKIILDVVFNHTCNFGEENLFPMFTYDSKNNPTISGMTRNKQYDFLPDNYESLPASQQGGARVDGAMKNPNKDKANIYHHEKNMAYEQYIEQTGQMAGDCVDLNTENPTVANYLLEAYGKFIEMGVDAFRIDTMKHISRLTFNRYLWPGLYEIARKCGNTNFYMFGEVCTRVREVWNHGQACDSAPFYTWQENKNYNWINRRTNEASTLLNWNDNANTNQRKSNNAYLSGMNYHTPDYSHSSKCGVIDFPMHWNFENASTAYRVATENDNVYNDASFNVTYVDSHDYGPDGQEKYRYKGGTDAWKENMSLLFTFRGIPCIYYGSEIEFKNDVEIDVGTSKPLEQTGRAYYGDHLSGNVTASSFGSYSANGEVAKTLNSTLSKHLIMLNKMRLKVPALRRGQYKSFGDLKFVRRYTSGTLDSVAAVAISGGTTFSGLPNGKYVDLVTGNSKTVTNGSLSVSVSGKGNLSVYVLDNGASGTLGKI